MFKVLDVIRKISYEIRAIGTLIVLLLLDENIIQKLVDASSHEIRAIGTLLKRLVTIALLLWDKKIII